MRYLNTVSHYVESVPKTKPTSFLISTNLRQCQFHRKDYFTIMYPIANVKDLASQDDVFRPD